MTRITVTQVTRDRCGEIHPPVFFGQGGWERRGNADLCPICQVAADKIEIKLCVAGSYLDFTIEELAAELHRAVDHIGRLPNKNPHQALYLQDREQKIRIYVLVNKEEWESET